MSREGANNRIDSLKNSLNHNHYNRTALGSAVRFNVAVNLMYDYENDLSINSFRTKEEFSSLMDSSVNNLIAETNNAINDEFNNNNRFDSEQPLQQRLQNRAYKTALGQTVAKATVQRKGLYQDFNTSYSTGATGAFRSFTNGFVQDDEDFFGSRVLYDNVFGNYEDGTESLSNRKRLSISDPLNNDRTVGEKVLDDVVNRSIYDQTEIIDRVDIEFGRFHGQSMIDQYSMTGSGLKSARQTIRSVMQEGSAYGRQVEARGQSDDHPVTLAQALIDRTNQDIDSTTSALNLLNNNLGNRSSTNTPAEGGYVNKAGVAEFIDLINSAGTRDANGSLTGGRISISSFQFQNETISAALTDKIQRHVLESVLQGGGAPLQIDLTLAYPRQRNINGKNDEDGRYAVGQTNYGILGPNLIEALKLRAVKEDVEYMLKGLGVSPDEIDKYVNLNVEFRDKKFHPKVYLTDNKASIGTQNLTAPVGTSINQAGSNFETMRFVNNSFVDNDTGLRAARQQFNSNIKTGNNLNNSITQSLLYRQISDSVNQEREFSNSTFTRAQGNTSTPIFTNQQGSQVGFAGDIYDHLKNTLDFAHTSSLGYQTKEVKDNSMHMFMILDQSFMLQLGSNSYSKQLKGEMGNEIGIPYSNENIQAREYQKQQHKLFDLLIHDKASVVVDTKNYKEGVLKPILDRINITNDDGTYANEKLRSNFAKYGQSFTSMAGFDLFKPSNSNSVEGYNKSLNIMFSELRRLGFTKEAGFDDTDLKQIIGLASGNIQMAKAPRQHAKEAALVQYGNNGPELISYYQGSSNMGLYSLGINSGKDGLYQKGDGDLTNTEMGIMLGRRDINKGLSRTTSLVSMSEEFKSSNNILGQNIELQEWILNTQEEEYELALAQRHLSLTWNQLSQGTSIEKPNTKNIGRPGWQDNVNTTDLNILKSRLETMSKSLGLSSKAFSISDRYGNVSGQGLTSINVSIDLSESLNSGGFMQASTKLPKLNFELTVLQGPSRGNGMFSDSQDDGSTPGFVYFVDKDKVVGNGLFVNESGQNISVLGRNQYEDDFVSDINKGGRINLKSGQSAHMSSLDIVPQLFATLMGETVSRFGAGANVSMFNSLDAGSRQTVLIDYVSNVLTGRTSQIDETVTSGSNIRSAMSQIKDNLNILSLQELNETINRNARSLENQVDSASLLSSDPLKARADSQELSLALRAFNNKWFHKLKNKRSTSDISDAQLSDFIQSMSNSDLNTYIEDPDYATIKYKNHFGVSDADVFEYISDINNLATQSPQLANMIMRTSYRDPNANLKAQGLKEFQTLLFGSFYQTKDDRTYGGQQGFYRTLLMGVTSNEVDKNTASLMFDYDDKNPSLQNLNAYARFKPLEYNPLTNIHDILYRSIASKSTSLTKNDSDLDSMLFESEARDLGDAANLRLMSSIGIGTIRHRDDFIIKDAAGNIDIGKDQSAIFESMKNVLQASNTDTGALDKARQAYLASMQNEFGDLNSEDRKDTVRLNFYTGSTKKLSQLPQRIKNAMGARPMYQYGIDAQMALERGESLNDLSSNYLQRYRDPLVQASKNKVITLLEQRERQVKIFGEDSETVRNIDNQIDDLKVIGAKGFANQLDSLGAIFTGRVKSVLNEEQISFITKTRARLENSIGDLIRKGELAEDLLDELVRVEIIKAGLTNKGLGKMISGSDHMNYSIALVQLSGTYNDTFLANPLYGTTYKSEENYLNIRANEIDIFDKTLNAADRDELGVYTLGQKEGQYETRQRSVKGSKMGAGGMQHLLNKDDIVVQDKSTGLFVHKRKVNGQWVVIGQADTKRNLPTISNLIDNNGFSPVGSPSLGSDTETVYVREGQNSINYIYSVDSREGNFANNEYLVNTTTLTSQDPSSGQRVEGTDTSSLVKGVAMFAGRVKYNSLNSQKEMNVFENLEDQIIKSYSEGQLGGSLKAYLDNKDVTQKVRLQDGREGYAPLSSSLHGLYNANNFKSFFWSHGATILKAQNDQGNKFMLDVLFDNATDKSSLDNAKKLAGALMFNFGTSFIQEDNKGDLTKLQRSLISEVVKGEFGSHYQQLAITHTQSLGSDLEQIFNNIEKRAGRSKGEIAQDLLFDKLKGASFSNTQLGALNILTSSELQKVLEGDINASKQILNIVRKGMIDPVSEQASKVGGINFNSSAHTQAALITTAVDFMHQLSKQGSKMVIPSEIDFDNTKVKEVLLSVIGIPNNIDDTLTEDIMEFLSGVGSTTTALSVFTDITFAYGKDPTGTQSIGKHEAQHLITPYLGDIKKYQEGGKLSNLQHTVAALAAMVTNTNSGLVFYDRMAKAGFNDKSAIDLVSEDSDFLFSSFNKEKFLGFYQSGLAKAVTVNYAQEYRKINTALLNNRYNWDSIQTVRDASDRTKFHSSDASLQEDSPVAEAYKQVERFVTQFHKDVSDIEKARLVDKYLAMGGNRFAIHQLDELTNMMIIENDKYQADPSKKMGMDNTGKFLENMNNAQMFFSIPDVMFETQNGEIVAKPSSKLISTILPSAADMRVLGGEYSGFVDPVIGHYKTLSSIFVPGTLTNSVFEKVRLSARDNRAVILSTEEYKAFQSVMDAAQAMPLELEKATAGARTAEAFAGKNKYQGFTATGIGNMLMPFGSVVASQTKLDQAGLRDNSSRLTAIRQSNEKIRDLKAALKINDNAPNNFYNENYDEGEEYTEDNKVKRAPWTETQKVWKVVQEQFHDWENKSYSQVDYLRSINAYQKEGFNLGASSENQDAQKDNVSKALTLLTSFKNSLIEESKSIHPDFEDSIHELKMKGLSVNTAIEQLHKLYPQEIDSGLQQSTVEKFKKSAVEYDVITDNKFVKGIHRKDAVNDFSKPEFAITGINKKLITRRGGHITDGSGTDGYRYNVEYLLPSSLSDEDLIDAFHRKQKALDDSRDSTKYNTDLGYLHKRTAEIAAESKGLIDHTSSIAASLGRQKQSLSQELRKRGLNPFNPTFEKAKDLIDTIAEKTTVSPIISPEVQVTVFKTSKPIHKVKKETPTTKSTARVTQKPIKLVQQDLQASSLKADTKVEDQKERSLKLREVSKRIIVKQKESDNQTKNVLESARLNSNLSDPAENFNRLVQNTEVESVEAILEKSVKVEPIQRLVDGTVAKPITRSSMWEYSDKFVISMYHTDVDFSTAPFFAWHDTLHYFAGLGVSREDEILVNELTYELSDQKFTLSYFDKLLSEPDVTEELFRPITRPRDGSIITNNPEDTYYPQLSDRAEIIIKDLKDKNVWDSLKQIRKSLIEVNETPEESARIKYHEDNQDNPFYILSQAAKKLGVSINTLSESDAKAGALGMYNPRFKSIGLSPYLNEVDKTATLFHELIHAYQDIREIPLMGNQEESFLADPNVHQSRGYDKEINLKEWQARSIENLYRTQLDKDRINNQEESIYIIKDIIDAVEYKEDKYIKSTFKDYGLSEELSEKYKHFTVFDIYKVDDEAEGDFLFSKKSFLVNIKKQIRAIKSVDELNTFADQLENNLDTYSKKERDQIQSILDKDIPAAFEIINKKKNRVNKTILSPLENKALSESANFEEEQESDNSKLVLPDIKPRNKKILPDIKPIFGPPEPIKITAPRLVFGPPDPSTRIIETDAINNTEDSSDVLNKNIYTFYKRQLAAESYGISSALEKDFNRMKLEAIEAKNQILDFQNNDRLSENDKKAAFITLQESIKQKRDIAYGMARINSETGSVISKSKEYSEKVLNPQDAYIYHAQALNYEALLAEVKLIGTQAQLVPLSHEVVKSLDKNRQVIAGVEFLLNSFEDKDGIATFVGLGHKESDISQDALFNNKVLNGEGMAGKHMKAIKQIGASFKGLNITEEAENAKLQYALQQIESSIQMYKARSEEMRSFNVVRESYGLKTDENGKPIVNEAVQRKIDNATSDYQNSTREVIDFLEQQKSKLLSGKVSISDLRNVFEDIDLKIVENDKANLYLGEVFRSAPLGGTDPRLHIYQIMQGVQALNKMSQMLSDTRQIGAQPKMIYSTERGQTATVLAALGVTTYGGGDFDGDSYTALFAQMEPTQRAIQDYKIKVDSNTVVIDNLNKKKLDLKSKIAAAPKNNPEDLKVIEDLNKTVAEIELNIDKLQENLRNDTTALTEARKTLTQQISTGHKNFEARARKQLSNYLGIDEAFFVKRGEAMFDAYGNVMVDEHNNPKTGLNMNKTLDADAIFAQLEKGYNLIEGIQSSSKTIIEVMNNIDLLLGHKSAPEAFNNGEFLNNLVKGIVTEEGKISSESPAIGMLKDRVKQLQNSNAPLTPEQKMFVSSLKDASDEHYKAYLQQFDTLSKEMEKAEAEVVRNNAALANEARKDFSKRAFINQWLGGNLYSAITSDSTLNKFMAQGVGMSLTEGTFDMTLKTLGKAGGEVLGKTYNTFIGTTFQDAPVITYGRQMLEDGDLMQATKSEFTRQLEGDSEYVSKVKQEVVEEGISKNDPRFEQRVKQKIEAQSLSKFEDYQEQTRQAVLKSEGTQGFMKNIHQLLRDSIKLKDGGGDLIETLRVASEEYDVLSKQIAANDESDEGSSKTRSELLLVRDNIISGMASKLGPGPGLKSLIDLDYLTNESDKTGLSRNDFEQRFLIDGGIDKNRQMLTEFSYSMKDLSEKEREELRDPFTIDDESSALLKVARNMTAKNLANMVTSFRMDNSTAEGRGQLISEFARDYKANLVTKLSTYSTTNIQTLESRTRDGAIDEQDEAGKYIRSKYGLIEVEKGAATFDANRQHKSAMGVHLGLEERHIYNDDGSVSEAYKSKLNTAAKKLGISNEEYTLMFDIHHEQSVEQVSGLFGQDGEKMEQFTVMNMMRKDIARSMMDGKVPSATHSQTINENIGSEVLTTMAQLATTGKLDSQGMDIFTGMYKGVVGTLLESSNKVVEYKDKVSGEMRSMEFTDMNQQQKSAYLTKLTYQAMLGNENYSDSGFNRSTSQESRDWKVFNSSLIANSTLELDDKGRLSNEFIDALDKAGANSSTGQQIEMYTALGEEYLRNSLDNEVQRNAIIEQYLPGNDQLTTKERTFYTDNLAKSVRSQMKFRQEQDSKKYAASRARHSQGRGVLQRSSFMNNINSSALDQLSTDTGANTLDLFVPLALTMIGTAISEGNVDGDQVMQLGGAAFTAFQYARTGTIESTKLESNQYKKRLASAQAMSGVFKLKNALAQQGDENMGAAIAQVAVQETTAIAFNAIATPWLSKQIAEKGLGVKHAPALNSLEMRKYQASHQLAGNLGASLISAVSSTLISGLFMRGMESLSESVGQTIESFMPAVNAVNAVNEAISKRRQQEAAYADFAAETDSGNEESISEYMVTTSASYDSNNYAHLADLNEPQDLEPSMDGSLSVDLLV